VNGRRSDGRRKAPDPPGRLSVPAAGEGGRQSPRGCTGGPLGSQKYRIGLA